MTAMLPSVAKSIKGQNRFTYALFSGLKAMAGSFGRTLYVLWLEMTGFIFAVFTVVSASTFVHQIQVHGWVTDKRRFWATVGFTAVSGWFTIASFVRARRTRKK